MTTTPAHVAKEEIYNRVTQSIITALESGVAPWKQSWVKSQGMGSSMPLRINGEYYQGINVIILWMAAQERGYTERRWMTFKQAQKLGAKVRAGEKGTKIIKAGSFGKEVEDPKNKDEKKFVKIPFIKDYAVFNLCQLENVPEKYLETVKADHVPLSENERLAAADAYFAAIEADVRHGGSQAFYSPSQDYVQLPEFGDFFSAEAYYATRGHEMVHWTRAEKRLNRSFNQKRFGDEGYAMEELVAELGAAFLCAQLGIEPEKTRDDHVSYLKNWIKVLKQDNRVIMTVASYAQKAVGFLNKEAGLVQDNSDDGDEEKTSPSQVEVQHRRAA